MVRQSNIEALRIVAMAMIVGLHHFNGSMGGALGELTPSDNNFYVAYFFESMFIIGVNCFILITGYFQIEKQSIKFVRVVELLVQMMFYALIFYVIAVVTGVLPLSPFEFAKAILPFFVGLRWFIKVFIILFLLIPFINLALNKLDKKTYGLLIIISFFFFSVWPSFLRSAPVTDHGYGIITFILLYAIGGYIKKFHIPRYSKKVYFSGYFICGLIVFAFSLVSGIYFDRLLIDRIWGYNFVFNMIGSVFIFLCFLKLDFKSKKVNYVAGFALGVYFVHSDPSINELLYGKLLQTDEFWRSPLFIIHTILSIVAVYAISTVIDMSRKWMFDKVAPYITPYFKKKMPILWRQIP